MPVTVPNITSCLVSVDLSQMLAWLCVPVSTKRFSRSQTASDTNDCQVIRVDLDQNNNPTEGFRVLPGKVKHVCFFSTASLSSVASFYESDLTKLAYIPMEMPNYARYMYVHLHIICIDRLRR